MASTTIGASAEGGAELRLAERGAGGARGGWQAALTVLVAGRPLGASGILRSSSSAVSAYVCMYGGAGEPPAHLVIGSPTYAHTAAPPVAPQTVALRRAAVPRVVHWSNPGAGPPPGALVALCSVGRTVLRVATECGVFGVKRSYSASHLCVGIPILQPPTPRWPIVFIPKSLRDENVDTPSRLGPPAESGRVPTQHQQRPPSPVGSGCNVATLI